MDVSPRVEELYCRGYKRGIRCICYLCPTHTIRRQCRHWSSALLQCGHRGGIGPVLAFPGGVQPTLPLYAISHAVLRWLHHKLVFQHF
jgi:hypothetical protein